MRWIKAIFRKLAEPPGVIGVEHGYRCPQCNATVIHLDPRWFKVYMQRNRRPWQGNPIVQIVIECLRCRYVHEYKGRGERALRVFLDISGNRRWILAENRKKSLR